MKLLLLMSAILVLETKCDEIVNTLVADPNVPGTSPPNVNKRFGYAHQIYEPTVVKDLEKWYVNPNVQINGVRRAAGVHQVDFANTGYTQFGLGSDLNRFEQYGTGSRPNFGRPGPEENREGYQYSTQDRLSHPYEPYNGQQGSEIGYQFGYAGRPQYEKPGQGQFGPVQFDAGNGHDNNNNFGHPIGYGYYSGPSQGQQDQTDGQYAFVANEQRPGLGIAVNGYRYEYQQPEAQHKRFGQDEDQGQGYGYDYNPYDQDQYYWAP